MTQGGCVSLTPACGNDQVLELRRLLGVREAEVARLRSSDRRAHSMELAETNQVQEGGRELLSVTSLGAHELLCAGVDNGGSKATSGRPGGGGVA